MTFDPRPCAVDDFPSLQRWLHETWRRGIALEQLEVERRREAETVHRGPVRVVPCGGCQTPIETTWTRLGKLCPACKAGRHRAAVAKCCANRAARRRRQ